MSNFKKQYKGARAKKERMVSLANVVCSVACLVACFFVHMACQKWYFEYCTSNIFLVLMFKSSTFCTVLKESARGIEMIFGRFLNF